jgi:hypothetical protein
MRINQKGQIIQDDPKLGKPSLRHGKRFKLIAFDDKIDVSLAPKEKPKGPEEKKGSHKAQKNLFPSRTQVQILEKVELIEGDKERKDDHNLFGKDSQQITEDGPPKVKELGLPFG